LSEQIFQPQSLILKVRELKSLGKKIGFVPTMGALHEGHLSLIRQSRQETDITIASIFVNPAQFNDKKDYDRYPRIVNKDIKLLADTGCDIVFTPSEADMYPGGVYEKVDIDLAFIGQTLEAAYRPGHFDGVLVIVKKLFDLVQPDVAFFGQKDYQQCLVISLLQQKFFPALTIRICDTVREADGLAMSSRNTLLTPEERSVALLISQTLSVAKKLLKTIAVEDVRQQAHEVFLKEKSINFEYFEIVDSETLTPVLSLGEAKRVIICTAMKVGNVRLIDNMFVS
jgi:pantoate--beta-alanine ligase